MVRIGFGALADQRRRRLGETAQQFVQRAQDLFGERGRDRELRLPAVLEQRAQAVRAALVEQPEPVQDQFQPAQQRTAGHARKRAQRERHPARGLAARRIDQAQGVVRDQDAGQHPGLAQQALEPLVRRRLPAFGRAAPVRVDAGGLRPDQKLPGRVVVEAGDRPVGRQRRVVLGNPDRQGVRQRRAAGRPGHQTGVPAEHRFEERPDVAERRPVRVGVDQAGRVGGVGRRLAGWCELAVLDHDR